MSHERPFSALCLEEQEKLRLIKSDADLIDVKFLKIWMDDNLPCVVVSINGIEIAFLHLDTETAADLMNPTRPEAKASIRLLLRQARAASGELDDTDEFAPQCRNHDSYGDEESYDDGDY